MFTRIKISQDIFTRNKVSCETKGRLKLKCNQKCFNSHCERENINKMPKDVNGNNSKKTTRKYYEKKKFEKKKKFIKICTMHISRVPISVFRKQGSKPFFS